MDHIFIRLATRRTSGWQLSSNGQTKMMIIGNLGYPRPMIMNSWGTYAFGMECPYDAVPPSQSTWINSGIRPNDNNWDELEVEIKYNTPGQSNGLIRMWINGILRIEQLNRAYRGPTPTSTGTCGANPSTHTIRTIQLYVQSGAGVIHYDRVAIGDTRIGPINGAPLPPDTQAPTVPANLRAQAVSSSQINLTWNASTDNVGVTGYRILRSGAQIGTAAGTTFSNTGLSASTAYSYTVAAYDAAGNTSGQSVAASTTTRASTTGPVGTVSNLSATAAGANSVTLSFTEVTDGTGQPAKYDVRFSSSGALWGGARSVAQGTCATPLAGTTVGATKTCTVLGLSPSTAYQFQLIGFRGTIGAGAVYGSLSNIAGASTSSATDVMPPAKPRNLRTR